MGLKIHTLSQIPADVERPYRIYVLDYGFSEPISDALRNNFGQMAERASAGHNSVVLAGYSIGEFNDEVLSWHNINGEDANDILPALLITTKNPSEFREHGTRWDDHLLSISLRNLCETPTDVVATIDRIFHDIEEGQELRNFEVAKRLNRGRGRALVDALILQPNFAGIGVNLKSIVEFFTAK
jgi:hypothetical protein